jgi:hypothetical protein
MREVVWEDPPADGRVRGVDWKARLAVVAGRPGEWARVWEGDRPHQKASYLKRFVIGQMGGRWELQGRQTSAGGTVYARYLGAQTNGDGS